MIHKVIIIKNGNLIDHLSIPATQFPGFHNHVIECIEGKRSHIEFTGEDGFKTVFPSIYLQNSTITYEMSDLEKQLQAQQG